MLANGKDKVPQTAQPHLRYVRQALGRGQRPVDDGQRLQRVAVSVHSRLHPDELVQDAQGHLGRLHTAHAACSGKEDMLLSQLLALMQI